MFAWIALFACGAPEVADPADAPAAAKAERPQADALMVTEPRARLMPPGAANSGAFMTFTNRTERELVVVGAKAPVAETLELHTHVADGGMMKMRQIPEIVVPARGQVVLKPGGLHVMLIGLHQPLTEGQRFPLVLQLADGSEKQIEVPVKAIETGH